MSVVLPAEADSIVVEGDETVVGDGNAVSVASQIVEDMFCPGERRLGVDDPVLTEELMEETAEAIGLSEADERAVELELVLVKDLLEPGGELAAEDAAEYADGQEETWRGGDPAGAILSQAASMNDAVDVGMMLEVLAPAMEYAEQTNVGSEMLRISRDFEHGRGTGAEE
jgi:hypothetical protein